MLTSFRMHYIIKAGGELKVTSKRKIFTLRLSPDLGKKIENESRRLGISQNAFVVMTLNEKLDKSEICQKPA